MTLAPCGETGDVSLRETRLRAGREYSGHRPGRKFSAPRARDAGMHPPFSFLCLAREKRMRRARWKRKERRFGMPSGVRSIHRQYGG